MGIKTDHTQEDLLHPCFNAGACRISARMHLPIAERCNIQCGYCSRAYDCVNESRPGVASRLMSPDEIIPAVCEAVRRFPVRVLGIAGPGDPLADPAKTFSVLHKLRAEFPDMLLCLSTNGLALADAADEILDLGLRHLTVTVNAVDPVIGKEIYDWVSGPHGRLYGLEGAQYLLEQQILGLQKLQGKGLHIKINTVCIPDINLAHIPEISEFASGHGAELHNIIPLIPIEGTSLGANRPPVFEELADVRQSASRYIKTMNHCAQCRADAVGFLHSK